MAGLSVRLLIREVSVFGFPVQQSGLKMILVNSLNTFVSKVILSRAGPNWCNETVTATYNFVFHVAEPCDLDSKHNAVVCFDEIAFLCRFP